MNESLNHLRPPEDSVEYPRSLREVPCKQISSQKRDNEELIRKQAEVESQHLLEGYSTIVYDESSSGSSVGHEEHDDELDFNDEYELRTELEGLADHEKIITTQLEDLRRNHEEHTELEGHDDYEEHTELEGRDDPEVHEEIEGHDDHDELEVEYVNVEQTKRKESQSCRVSINKLDETKPDETKASQIPNLNVFAQNEEESLPSKPPRAANRTKHDGNSSAEVLCPEEHEKSSEERDQTLESKSSRPTSMDDSTTTTILTIPEGMTRFEYFARNSHDDDDVDDQQVSFSPKARLFYKFSEIFSP